MGNQWAIKRLKEKRVRVDGVEGYSVRAGGNSKIFRLVYLSHFTTDPVLRLLQWAVASMTGAGLRGN